MSRWGSFGRAWAGVRAFSALDSAARAVVFYGESAASWVHLGPVATALLDQHDQHICYLASDEHDPMLKTDDSRIQPFFVGSGILRTHVFWNLQAGVLVTTTPDLESFHVKRSRRHPVHYVYIHHSIVSTHMVYRREAFDQFDAMCCVGPHHVAETRAAERVYNLSEKRLIEHGYGRLDTLMAAAPPGGASPARSESDPVRVLVAPSWGPHAVLESCGVPLVEALLAAGCHVTVRPHPITVQRARDRITELTRRFGEERNFVLETNIASQDSLHAADVMISDWSGAAFEFAFALERPVLFIDVERKVNNPEYERLQCEPLEAAIRPELGDVLSPDCLDEVGVRVRTLHQRTPQLREQICRARAQWIYNLGTSGPAAAAYIAEAAETARAKLCTTSPA